MIPGNHALQCPYGVGAPLQRSKPLTWMRVIRWRHAVFTSEPIADFIILIARGNSEQDAFAMVTPTSTTVVSTST
ncbi:hypothetical protein GQ607_015635 [Colletotrichum asianum]|uniref:Uncharacterized protein n=1 Tax=Colletotrichum asianum TaxID=702518 RepID=A0A8H3W2L9_9PEZI|nr:hypothetical protein GQ607_015635 [Colletotrichum asianum]